MPSSWESLWLINSYFITDVQYTYIFNVFLVNSNSVVLTFRTIPSFDNSALKKSEDIFFFSNMFFPWLVRLEWTWLVFCSYRHISNTVWIILPLFSPHCALCWGNVKIPRILELWVFSQVLSYLAADSKYCSITAMLNKFIGELNNSVLGLTRHLNCDCITLHMTHYIVPRGRLHIWAHWIVNKYRSMHFKEGLTYKPLFVFCNLWHKLNSKFSYSI